MKNILYEHYLLTVNLGLKMNILCEPLIIETYVIWELESMLLNFIVYINTIYACTCTCVVFEYTNYKFLCQCSWSYCKLKMCFINMILLWIIHKKLQKIMFAKSKNSKFNNVLFAKSIPYWSVNFRYSCASTCHAISYI